MEIVIVLSMLAQHSPDEDAIVLLILSIPALIIWGMIIWAATSPDREEDTDEG